MSFREVILTLSLPQIVRIVILLILCIEILMVWRNCYLNQLIITLLIFLFILTAGLFDTVRGNSVLVTCGIDRCTCRKQGTNV